MRLFSRNKAAAEAVTSEDVPFQALRRSPRNIRKPRSTSVAGADFDKGSPLDPAEASKTRARRRLIGAVALALAAIVFVPMLFDRTPVAPADDIGLQIPDRDAPFEGRRGVPDPAKSPLRASGELPTTTPAAPAADSLALAVPDTAAPTPEKPAEKPMEAAPVPKAAAPVAKPVEKVPDKPVEKARSTSTAQPADDPRALAALEGKTEPPASGTDNRQYAVQIAAFSSTDRAKGLRDQLVANGLKSYVESVSTAQGMRTRVRLGPFASRDAADHAKQKLKTMKLDGSVVPL